MRQLVRKGYYTRSQVPFTCGELTLHENTVNGKNIMSLIVDYNFDYNKRINEKVSKAQKEISSNKKLFNVFLRNVHLTIYKSFFRRHLDYCDIVTKQSNNRSTKQSEFFEQN